MIRFKPLIRALILALMFSLATCYEAPDDCDWSELTNAEISLICRLSAINSRSETTNFSVIPPQRTSELTVECQNSHIQSHLEGYGFKSLVDLKVLKVLNCNIDELPPMAFGGLQFLTSLTLSSSAPFLKLNNYGLDGLKVLENLDLSHNQIRDLPKNVLCGLSSLTSLNLSYNRIGSLEQLFGNSEIECSNYKPTLSELNLSNNEITILKRNHISKSLKKLDLSHNYIRFIEMEALPSGNNCTILNLSNNQIAEIPATFFLHGSLITSLNLANNSLSTISPQTFDGMKALKTLDLSGNHITQLSHELFPEISTLSNLFLHDNKLIHFQLKDLNSLKVLKIQRNQLKTLSIGSSLIDVNASDNLIGHLDLKCGSNLTHLYLSQNNLTALSDSLFINCSKLMVVDLSHNRLSKAPTSMSHLKSLQTLDLSDNKLQDLTNAPFLEMNNLWRLQLSGNYLETVSVNLLEKLRSLQIIDLSSNSIQKIERGSFDANQRLKAIRIDANNLTQIEGLFTNLDSLTWLNVSDNRLEDFDYSMVPRSLQWLDISYNSISELGNYFNFELANETKLSFLDASFNYIKILGPHNIPDSVSTLNVNDNSIDTIVPYTFFKKTRLSKVDLRVNDLETIDPNALRLNQITEIPIFYIGGNPISCDCHMVWFKSINQGDKSVHQYPRVADIESIYCKFGRSNAYVSLVEAPDHSYLCPYVSHCFALCHCCDFDACDCEMTCPDGCTCYHDNSWTQNIATCSNAGLEAFPKSLPIDATELLLDGNKLPQLKSNSFIGRKNLRLLHLNSSQVHHIERDAFNGLINLRTLYLDHNDLSSLQGHEFKNLSILEELYLHTNIIKYIHNSTFTFTPKLKILTLHNNKIVQFPIWSLSLLNSVSLSNNPWTCSDCLFMDQLKVWTSEFSGLITDSESFYCTHENRRQDLVIQFDIETCYANASLNHSQGLPYIIINNGYLPLVAGILACLALLLLIILSVYVFRKRVGIWIYTKYQIRCLGNSPPDSEDDKLFDLFVTYSFKDSEFVHSKLASELESEYKCCLHYRDLPRQAYLSDTILEATEASRRTMVVLSNHFLKSEWSRYDYKSGFHQALRKNHKRKLLLIILGEIENRDLDPDLRLYLKHNSLLHWGDKKFWHKLKYFLPDVKKRGPPNNQQQQHWINSNSSTNYSGGHKIEMAMSSETMLTNLPGPQIL